MAFRFDEAVPPFLMQTSSAKAVGHAEIEASEGLPTGEPEEACGGERFRIQLSVCINDDAPVLTGKIGKCPAPRNIVRLCCPDRPPRGVGYTPDKWKAPLDNLHSTDTLATRL